MRGRRPTATTGSSSIGVHTPEFSFEHDLDLVRQATEDRGIDYPVAVDNDYAVWSAFDNHYWPALYFVDRDGVIRDHHFGEGRYEQSERLIQRLLGVDRELVSVEGVGVEAEADWDNLRTPETYLGYGRGERFASPTQPSTTSPHVRDPRAPALNHWALVGEWTIGPREGRCSTRPAAASPSASTRATRTSCCRPAGTGRSRSGCSSTARLPGRSHGADVDEDGNGLLDDGRLYQLVREHGRGPRANTRDHLPRARRRGVRRSRSDSRDADERGGGGAPTTRCTRAE